MNETQEHRDRSKRPSDIIKAEFDPERLDGRTKAAQAMKAMQKRLEEDPSGVTMEILRRDISMNDQLSKMVMTFVLRNPGKVINEKTGQIEQSIFKDLLKLQEQNRRALIALHQLSPKCGNDTLDYAKVVMEAE